MTCRTCRNVHVAIISHMDYQGRYHTSRLVMAVGDNLDNLAVLIIRLFICFQCYGVQHA